MTTVRDAIREKFGGSGSLTRRFDFKGPRRRINLRVGADVAANLNIIRLATGEPTNVFCERILTAAIKQTLSALESTHDPQAWKTIQEIAGREQKARGSD